jgi:hypothetical protein
MLYGSIGDKYRTGKIIPKGLPCAGTRDDSAFTGGGHCVVVDSIYCSVTLCRIVRYQLPYSETYSDDIKEVLGVIEWKFHEAFATEELPRGLSLRSFESGLSRTCLDALKRLNNDVQPAPNPPWSWIETATKYMAECSGGQ